MRIAVVHSFYSRANPSGENSVVEAQVGALVEAGHDVLLVARETDVEAESPLYGARTAVRVATGLGAAPSPDLHQFRPDVVHVHNLFPNFGTRWLQDWAGPVIATMHNFRPMCAAGILFRDGRACDDCSTKSSIEAIRHRCYRGSALASAPLAIRTRNGAPGDALVRRANLLVALSDRAAGLYEAHGVDRSKLRIVPNFVESVPGPSDESEPAPWIYAGRLTPEKGIQELLQHWPEGQALTIVGDGPLAGEVSRWSQRSGNSFLGRVPAEAVRSMLVNANGLVLPSLWAEGIPTSYLEACAAGVPTLAFSANSAADEILEHGGGKVLTAWRDLPSLVAAVADQREVLGAEARQHYESAFAPASWLRAIEGIYTEVTL